MVRWARVTLPYACYGVAVNEQGIVIDAAPIARWMVGRYAAEAATWVVRKRGSWEWLEGPKTALDPPPGGTTPG